MVSTRLTGQWQYAVTIFRDAVQRAPTALDSSVQEEAHYFTKFVNKAFVQQGIKKKWTPLSEITKQLRRNAKAIGGVGSRGTKALIRTGQLRRSVKVHRRGLGDYFVGVHKSAPKGRATVGKGVGMYNVARVHETGMTVIPITEKMRAFFRFLLWKGVIEYPWPPPNKKYILIPQRSFMQQAMDEFAPGHQARLLTRYAMHLGGLGKLMAPNPSKPKDP